MIEPITGPEVALTAGIIDETFPLQSPNGAASHMKAALERGEQGLAEAIFLDLCAADHDTIEQMATELLVRHELPGDIDVLRALRLGLKAGRERGRQEGANVVEEIMSLRGEI